MSTETRIIRLQRGLRFDKALVVLSVAVTALSAVRWRMTRANGDSVAPEVLRFKNGYQLGAEGAFGPGVHINAHDVQGKSSIGSTAVPGVSFFVASEDTNAGQLVASLEGGRSQLAITSVADGLRTGDGAVTVRADSSGASIATTLEYSDESCTSGMSIRNGEPSLLASVAAGDRGTTSAALTPQTPWRPTSGTIIACHRPDHEKDGER